MYMLSITDETADSMFRDILRKDYLGLKEDIRLLQQQEQLQLFEQQDLENCQRYVAAMQIIMEYYYPAEELDQLLADHA